MIQASEKKQTAEEVQWENRVAFNKSENDRLAKAKEALQAEIEKKSSDYAIHIAQKDMESKKLRQEVLDANEKLTHDKAEFQVILKNFQQEKASFIDGRKGLDNEKAKNEAQMNNIREFVIAVQRACSLLGL